ncbi:hypothetical protein G6F62_010837 [Rhizopus arrhizus]|nr:hypothetical protein G6F62_010837 [Rhizopus arrhizus]
MIENPTERGKVTLHAKDLGINPRTAMRWWKHYQETRKVLHKNLQRNPGRPDLLTTEHEQHIQQIVKKDSRLCADNIIDSLKSQFEDLKISKSQMNHHLRNNMFISIKQTFDPMARDSDSSLQTRYEWFMKWKGSDLGYTKNCVFIDEDDQSRTQLNAFLSSYPEDYTFQENSIYYDIMASPENYFKAFFRLAELSEAEQTKQFACFPLHLNKKAFKHQGFQKTLRFQGTLETDGVGVSIIKQNTDTSRKSPKPITEKKVDGNQTEHIEGLGQADLKSTEGKCVLIDPGRRDLMYCMKETSTVEEKQTLIFTKNNRSKCSRHFRYLRKRTQPFVVQKAEAILSRSESNSVDLKKFVENIFP